MNFVVAAALAMPPFANAAPGDLDLDFGGWGDGGRSENLGFISKAAVMDAQGRLVIVGTSGGTFYVQRRSGFRFETIEDVNITILSTQTSAAATAVAIAPDGKIVVAGRVQLETTDFAVARLNPDLTLDETFAGDGTAHSDFNDESDVVTAVAVQDDLKIVVVGWTVFEATANDWAIERFQENGELDPSFSENGKATFDPSDVNIDIANAVALDGDKILIGGDSERGFTIGRLNSDGSLDESFGDNGYASAFGISHDGNALAVRDGFMAIVGGPTITDHIFVARFLSDGTPDPAFGVGGTVVTDVDGNAKAFAVAIQPDGKTLVAGRNFFDADPDRFVLVRYNTNGTLDQSFGEGGFVFTSFGNAETGADELLLQPDGWFFAFGGAQAARYRPNGALDAGGVVSVVFDQQQVAAEAGALIIDGAGRIVAGGHVRIGARSGDAALARFSANGDGALDTTFGNGDPKSGVTVYGSPLDEKVHAIARFGDATVVVGQIGDSPNTDFLVGRYLADGTPDPSCAFAGYNVEDFNGGDDVGRAVGFGSGIIFASGTIAAANEDYGVAPFNASDCTPDIQYGLQVADLGGSDILGGAVVQSPRLPIGLNEDRVVLAGSTGTDIGLTRVEADPLLPGFRNVDTSFGTGGKTVVPTGSSEAVTAVTRQSNGALIVAGWSAGIDTSDFFVARFSALGALDTTFGTDGFAYADFGVNDNAHAVAVRGDNSIVVAGCNNDFGSRIAVAQFTPNGQLDVGFSGDGTFELEISGVVDCARAVRFLGGRHVVVAGYADGGGNPSFVVAQIETTQDPTVATTTTTITTTTTATTTTTTLPSGPCGDANDDDNITATDALAVLNAAVGLFACELCVCDVDDSGSIAATDALTTLREAVGLGGTLDCPACVPAE